MRGGGDQSGASRRLIGVMTLPPRSSLVASLLLLGCVPLPESLGDGLDTDSDASGPGSSGDEGLDSGSSAETAAEDGDDQLEPEPRWDILFDGSRCTGLAVVPDGGPVVLIGGPDADGFVAGRELRRYAADGTLSWQREDGTDLVDVATLPDGRIVIGGSVSESPRQAALWLLTPEGDLEASYVQPLDGTGDDALVTRVATSASGVGFVVLHLDPDSVSSFEPTRYETGLAGLDLVPQWWTPEVDGQAAQRYGVEIAASGSLRTLQLEFEPQLTRMLTYSASGVLEGDEEVSPTIEAAEGEPGVLLGLDDAGLRIRGLEEAMFGQILVPQDFGSFPVAYHRDGLFIGGAAAGGLGSVVVRLDDEGNQLYLRTFSSFVNPYVLVRGIAPAPDESIYLCGVEAEDGGQDPRGFLSRRYPLW